MKTNVYEARVTPGRRVYRLTRNEVCEAVFRYAVGRIPSPDEKERLRVNVHDDPHHDWELTLSIADADK